MSSDDIQWIIREALEACATTLDLSQKQLATLPPELAQLSNLQILDLSGNQLSTVPPELAQLTNLQQLDLSDNQLSQIPPEIAQLTRLVRLSVTKNGLRQLPGEIGDLRRLKTLGLGNNQLTQLPPEIGQLTNLTRLVLSGNELTYLPPELGRLANLAHLSLSRNKLVELPGEISELGSLIQLVVSVNQLTRLPPEIGLMTNLAQLVLRGNQLTQLPSSIGQLTNLSELVLSENQVAQLPPEIGQLTSLRSLNLRDNRLTVLPPQIGHLGNLAELHLGANHLTTLPAEMGQLTNLQRLDLTHNRLTTLPPELGQLTNLQRLDLTDNRLTTLPPELAQLTNLQHLDLWGNELTALHREIGELTSLRTLNLSVNQLTTLPLGITRLTNLQQLYLSDNQLTTLPPEVAQCTNLEILDLTRNQLTTLPPELAQLTNLRALILEANQLTTLPPEMGQLTELRSLGLEGNPLTSPPPEIVQQGTSAVLTYLRERLESSVRQWVSKLLLVGEGGVGKTSLVRGLLGEPFDAQLTTTHGVEIRPLVMPHPTQPGVTMHLNAWDFGGQQIYHATHQFFLTNRSLFLLVWNARHGYEQGKLYHWMDTIQALAPQSPVLVVATHIDERDADLPFSDLKRTYPQIIGRCEVSNLDGRGVQELRDKIATAAADLPLMGELWPTTWLRAAEAVRAMPDRYITPSRLRGIFLQHQVGTAEHAILAQWLHELGEILYFQHEDELKDVVVLQPQWVSAYISKVLESEEVVASNGIFTRTHMDELWADLDPPMREHFLNLMERFDLSYRTLENPEISLVVERLPLDPPDYEAAWQAITEREPCREIAMRFYLDSLPAGIPTWFIARSHRFTTHTHWRQGALFAYGPERLHLALVQAFPHDRYLQLAVRGPSPHNFFALVRDGIELTLNRFPGLHADCKIPCPGHDGQPCSHEFDHDQLVTRLEKRPVIECPQAMEDVSVPQLLFGVHWAETTQSMLMSRLDLLEDTIVQGQEEMLGAVLTELGDLRELAQREFTKLFRLEQSKIESHCPNIFALRPRDTSNWHKAIVGRKVDLQLYCQAPGQWHPTERGGLYALDQPAEWIAATAPYIRRLVSVLKFATPLISPILGAALPDYSEIIKNDLHLIEQLLQVLPDIREDPEPRLAKAMHEATDGLDAQRAEGAALRALRLLLDEKDPEQHWGELRKVLTPEGHYLWLCESHALAYAQ